MIIFESADQNLINDLLAEIDIISNFDGVATSKGQECAVSADGTKYYGICDVALENAGSNRELLQDLFGAITLGNVEEYYNVDIVDIDDVFVEDEDGNTYKDDRQTLIDNGYLAGGE